MLIKLLLPTFQTETMTVQSTDNTVTLLNGDGDFRSEECIELLEEADIVATNPAFSLFREFIDLIIKHNKKFVVIGPQNAITYKEIFPLIQNNKMWLGYPFPNGNAYFYIPKNADISRYTKDVYDPNTGKVHFRNCCWFTNLDIPKRHEELILVEKYSPAKYPHYDNYDAIEVSKTAKIPCDYDGIMGVPLTFMDKYSPEQFEILGCTQRGCHDLVPDTKKYDDHWEVRPDGSKTGYSGAKTNENGNLSMNDEKHNYFTNKDGQIIRSTYARIFIRNKHPQK